MAWQSLHYCSAVGDYSQSRELSIYLRATSQAFVFGIESLHEAQGWL